jgi:hypothetical protein
MKSNTVTLYRLPWTKNYLNERDDWFLEREIGFSYLSKLKGESAAEEAFHLTNAPTECLTEEQQDILNVQKFKGPSLSTGDIVRVEAYPAKSSNPAEYYLCKSIGWEKYKGSIIELIKHLSW